MEIVKRKTRAFTDQKPGTSGLRKKVRVFQQHHYLENFSQAVFNTIGACSGRTLVIGGDGRFYNREAIAIIIRMGVAQGFGRLLVGQDGILSTPAASCLIRKSGAAGGMILSASHNPGGPDADFGVKFNGSNGGPAPESLTTAIYEQATKISEYSIADELEVDIGACGETRAGSTTIEVIDSVAFYTAMMRELFDFELIARHFSSGFRFSFDAMHAVTGPYAVELFENQLGAPPGTVRNGLPLMDFGGGHPDPNLKHAHELVALMFGDDPPDFAAASDGDGDRNMVLGAGFYINPCDSLAVITAQAACIPAYASGLRGVARSMPTSRAVDRVARSLSIECFETPTGWKFFGNLLDAGRISLCGEESFGTGSDHVREKDGLWAVMCWLNILATQRRGAAAIVRDHWQRFGRDYFTRHDYEGIDSDVAEAMYQALRERLDSLPGQRLADGSRVIKADDFAYVDPVDGGRSADQGLRVFTDEGGRLVFRLSGTGTAGATLRVYLDRHEQEAGKLELDPQQALRPLIAAARQLIDIEARTGRIEPDVIT